MLTCITNRNTTFYRVVFQCYNEAGAIELMTILRGIHCRPAVYIRQVSFLTAFLPVEFVTLLQACQKPFQCQTIRYFKLGDRESLAVDVEIVQ